MQTFSERVVKLALSVPKGRVTTYGRIARAAGAGSMASQSVTGILAKASRSGVGDIPWHRIVYADGRAWFDGATKKKRLALYAKERIEVNPKSGKIRNFGDIVFDFG